MKVINKIRLINFKRFTEFEVKFDDKLNLIIGDNESGKSTILLALDIVLSGSRSKVETLGLESLFNTEATTNFMASVRKIEDLPVLYVEAYLNEQNNPNLEGKNNLDQQVCNGLRFCCVPNLELSKELKEILAQQSEIFPFEYYTVNFHYFSGDPYTGYGKYLKHLFIDNSQVNNEYAMREYIKNIYNSNVLHSEKNKHHNQYRKYKEDFKNDALRSLNERTQNYYFQLRTTSRSNLESDLTIAENGIIIENKGKGRQCLVKTEFALQQGNDSKELDLVLLEEPENHLSHINMKKLIRGICDSKNYQLFIATHNSLLSSRLDLRKSILLNSNSTSPAVLDQLPESTAKFFMKAPDNNILEFILSKKILLLEGDAEFLLIEGFYKSLTNQALEDSDIHILSVDGTSFKRYLDLAALLKIKTAVVRDNDGNYEEKCVQNYTEYKQEFIKIFYDTDNSRRTFEICLYQDNKVACDELFSEGRRTLSVEEYMISNKTTAAFELLEKKANCLNVPKYIQDAIAWIKE